MAAGFAVHVPHYVAQNNYPVAAEALLRCRDRLTGLVLPSEQLADAGRQVRVLLDEQAAADSDISEMVTPSSTSTTPSSGPRVGRCWPPTPGRCPPATSWAPSWSVSWPTRTSAAVEATL